MQQIPDGNKGGFQCAQNSRQSSFRDGNQHFLVSVNLKIHPKCINLLVLSLYIPLGHPQLHLTLVSQDERAALKHHLAGEVVLHHGGGEADAGAAPARGVLRDGRN